MTAQIIPNDHTKGNELIGQRIGKLVVVSRDTRSSRKNAARFICQCDCGNKISLQGCQLRQRIRGSCGCGKREWHNASNTAIYGRWKQMIRRCSAPRCEKFHTYGARGIYVCERWKSFENFYADMGDPPTNKHSIERINNDGPYSPENCRWAVAAEQQRNTTRNVIITFNGQAKCLEDWAQATGISRNALEHRIARGWSIERMLTERVHSST